MFWLIILIIAIVSIGLSFWSLHYLEKKHEIMAVKKNLSRGKVLYQAPHKGIADSVSSSDTSSS